MGVIPRDHTQPLLGVSHLEYLSPYFSLASLIQKLNVTLSLLTVFKTNHTSLLNQDLRTEFEANHKVESW